MPNVQPTGLSVSLIFRRHAIRAGLVDQVEDLVMVPNRAVGSICRVALWLGAISSRRLRRGAVQTSNSGFFNNDHFL